MKLADLLALILPESDRDSVIGDLEEERNRLGEVDGRVTADLWYRRQVIRELLPAFRRRLALRARGDAQ